MLYLTVIIAQTNRNQDSKRVVVLMTTNSTNLALKENNVSRLLKHTGNLKPRFPKYQHYIT